MLALLGLCGPQSPETPGRVRPEAARLIEILRAGSVDGPAHTTDSLQPQAPRRLKPAPPAVFPAGTYKTVATARGDHAVLWVLTEAQLPHYVPITPGATSIPGATVRLSDDATSESATGLALTDAEIDVLIQAVYERFCAPLDSEAAKRLNALKDMLLAVRYTSARDVQARHSALLKRVCR